MQFNSQRSRLQRRRSPTKERKYEYNYILQDLNQRTDLSVSLTSAMICSPADGPRGYGRRWDKAKHV